MADRHWLMIISASYRTDIPAFYGQWFLNRLRAGYCRVLSPYGGAPCTIDLRPQAVDGFVFWTKNIGPFLPVLEQVRAAGYPFIVQLGINSYPRELERCVISPEKSAEHAWLLARRFGRRVVVWRYDTIVFSSLTAREFHIRTFSHLAECLAGAVDEVVISFAQIYRKTLRNMNLAARQFNFTWEDPPDQEKRRLVCELLPIARRHGMKLSICGQRQYLVPGAEDAHCIDMQRLSDVAGRHLAAKARGHRNECGCHQSRDIGAYDTCPHGCVYCYAVTSHALACRRFRQHDPEGEFLLAPGQNRS